MSPTSPPYAGGQEVRILIVEDAPADADLLMREVRRLGITASFRLVQEEDAYRKALLTFRPHLVLVDYRFPRFSGRRALKLARAYDPELPVILVTGFLSERKVLRLVRLGLANYVFKDGMPRLGPAVVQALDRSVARQKEAEARRHAHQLEGQLLAVARASGDGVVIVDASRCVVFWNDAALRMLGISREPAIGTDASAFVADEDRARFDDFWPKALAAPEPLPSRTVELTARDIEGREFPVEISVGSWDDDGERFFSAFLRDISRRKAATRERNLLSRALEQASDLVIITDRDARIEYVNPAFEEITGYKVKDVIGLNPRILQGPKKDPELYLRMWAELTAGRNFTTEFFNQRKDGTAYLQRSSVFPILDEAGRVERYVGIGQDVTNERHLEKQLRQAQKMEAVGQLTAGVAHDFNNLLTAIIGQSQFLMEELPPEHSAPGEPAVEILAAAQRAAELVRRLMVFSRNDRPDLRVVDIRDTLNEVVAMATRVLTERIRFAVEHAPEPLPCLVDPGSLQQAALNLLNNGRDAMPNGGKLTLSTRMEPADGDQGPVAVIQVEDSGVGIPADGLERIFEPFYTTKPAGKGTGLGLSMVYAFVRNSNGQVDVTSTPGRGTTFTVRIPLASEAVAEQESDLTEAVAAKFRARRGETILFAEDQKEIRELGRQILQRLGYRVLTASDGPEAQEILHHRRHDIDLVVTDLVMPGGGGVKVYQSTAAWDQRPRFLFSSGYAPQDHNDDMDVLRAHPFLAKPWGVRDLAAAVRSALDS